MPDRPDETGGSGNVSLHVADLARAKAVAGGEAAARRWFAQEYTERIFSTAYSWCRPYCRRAECVLKRRRSGSILDRIFGQDCDEVSEAYRYLLDQLENRIVGTYEGRCSLDSYLFSVFSPRGFFYDKVRVSFIQHYKGKLHTPKWAESLSKADQKVLKELRKRTGVDAICRRLELEPDQVEESRERIEAAARKAGDTEYWGLLMSILGRDVPLPTKAGDFTDDPEIDLPDESMMPDKGVIARDLIERATAGLDATERVVLRLLWEEGLKAVEVAAAVQIDRARVARIEAKALKRLVAALNTRRRIDPAAKNRDGRPSNEGKEG